MAKTLTRADGVTADEFFRMRKSDGRSVLVDGRIIEWPPVGPLHGDTDAGGVRRVWIFDPRLRQVHVFEPGSARGAFRPTA